MVKKTFIADKNKKLSKLALYYVEGISYTVFCTALRKKDVKINGVRQSKDVMLEIGDTVEIFFNQLESEKYNILYENSDVLVVNKKKGYESESVFNAVKEYNKNARFIHRLDRNTDGILIFALNDISEIELLEGFKERTFDKIYRAEVVGFMNKKQDVLTAYLVKDKDNSLVTIFDREVKGSKLIKTGYKVIKETEQTSVLEVTLFTGKTHQIRAHLAHIGHPIVGDGKYGDFEFNQKNKEKTQKLSAVKLTLKFQENSPLFYLSGKTFEI